RLAVGGGEPDAAAAGQAWRHERRADLYPVPQPEGAAAQPRHQAFRRRTTDAGDRSHPAHRRKTPAAGRADRRACAGDHPADRPHHRDAQGTGLHHRAGGTEFPLRLDRGGPALRCRARQGYRHDPQRRTRGEYRQTARLSRRVEKQTGGHANLGGNGMRKTGFLLASLAASLMASSAFAQDISVKIGVLNDRSGIYADITGEGSVIAAQLAAEDFGTDKGIKVEIVSADHQNKADVGANIARQWYDAENVDAIVDVPTSSIALAINDITKEKNKVFLNSGAG